MEVLPAGEGHTNVLATHPYFIRLPEPQGPGGQRLAGNTSHIHGIHPPNQLKHVDLEGTKMQLFVVISAPPPAFCFHGSMCVVAGYKSISWELYPAWGGNGEVRMQRWNFPLESCKMQTTETPK